MLESLILVALGFLVASLFALVALQFVWRRAVTQTTRRLGLDVKTYSDAEAFTKAGRAIPDLELALTQREQELAVLAERNANLAEALQNAQAEAAPLRDELVASQNAHHAALIEAQNLRNEIDNLYMRLSKADAEAAERTGKLHAMQSRLGEFGAVIAAEVAGMTNELDAAIGGEATASWRHAAPAAPEPAGEEPVDEEPTAPIQLGEKEREDFDAVLPAATKADDELPEIMPAELSEMDISQRIETLETGAPH